MNDTPAIETPAGEDALFEQVVLRRLLELHPIQPTRDELVREIGCGEADFATTDAVERALQQLTATGLVNRNGEVLVPSRAALRFYELLE